MDITFILVFFTLEIVNKGGQEIWLYEIDMRIGDEFRRYYFRRF